ncbi:MAG: 16S rRNA (guanine(527)-N(7))-methyltransferase RsmG [Lentisphaeria bacterium]|nr:16S rRNA (guanine(527)-N(7))-methyltransferase RsmG [Lentisphaeria bacterium]
MSFSLAAFAARCNIIEPDRFAVRCEKLRCFLEDYNHNVNLTRITGKEDFELKHAADSLSIFLQFPELLKKSIRIADIGCGAGFPSLILALAVPEWDITAIDSTGKKITFVNSAAGYLGLKNLRTVHGRAVELNCKAEFRQQFDIVTARAVAPSPKIYNETKNFLRHNGRYIFYKTPSQAEEEFPELARIKNVSWQLGDVFELPQDSGCRRFIIGVPR